MSIPEYEWNVLVCYFLKRFLVGLARAHRPNQNLPVYVLCDCVSIL